MTGAHHIRQGQERAHHGVVAHPSRDGDKRAVRDRDPDTFGLTAQPIATAEESSVDARRLHADAAVRTCPVAVGEGRDDEVPLADRTDRRADCLDDSDEFVADTSAVMPRLAPPVPQVRPADTGEEYPDDRVRRSLDRGIGDVLDDDVTRCVEDGGSHVCATFSDGVPTIARRPAQVRTESAAGPFSEATVSSSPSAY